MTVTDALGPRFERRAIPSDRLIDSATDALLIKLPLEYRQFLAEWDGGTGFFGRVSYLHLWRVSQLVQYNVGCDYLPAAQYTVFVGDTGGHDVVGWRSQNGRAEYVVVDLIGATGGEEEFRGKQFVDFIHSLP